ncbi:MAG TPA: GAF domain-containing protein, partial [Methylomirabilota bacterium]|nr:GAF domain-containing protein [Methylomirabilota bacterium]
MEHPSNLAPRGEPSGALDFAPAASLVLATALRLLGGRRAHLYRLDPDGETFMRVAAAGEGDAKMPLGRSVSADIAMSGRAVRESRAICTPDVLAEPNLSVEPSERTLTAREGVAALAAVPLRAGGQMVGALVLADRTGRRYTDQELVLLSVFGDQAVLLFENARSRAELVRRQHEAFELARVARLIGETLDLATVSDRIAERVLGLLAVHSSAIRLSRPDGTLGAIALGGRAK